MRKTNCLWAILLVFAGRIGGYCWYWQSTAVDLKVRELV